MVCLFKKNACQRHLDAWVLVVGWARFNKRTETARGYADSDNRRLLEISNRVTKASTTASATWPLCSLIAAGVHPLCSIDIGDAPYQEGCALFRKSLGGIGGGLIVKAILSQRYPWDSRPGCCGFVPYLPLAFCPRNLLPCKAV
jgi:hypothetical protein